ncbi:MTH1187 family thiamine-binding protein [bacterium]|nr:MTH1187 family thiamine-binding protein [bacterium]
MLAELTMFPLGKVSGLSAEVSKVLELIERSGLPYQLTAMGTLVEGEWDEVMGLVGRCRERLLQDNERLYIVLKIDDHKGRTGKLSGKVASVEKKLGRALHK